MFVSCEQCVYRNTDQCEVRRLEEKVGKSIDPAGCTSGLAEPGAEAKNE